MAYTNNKLCHNSEDFTANTKFNETIMTLINDADNSVIAVDLELTHCVKPTYAITVHECQGMIIHQLYSIYEHKQMTHDMLYVCLTRTSKQAYINFCAFECIKPYTSYIYRYSHTNIYYIGCTIDITKTNTKNIEAIQHIHLVGH